MVNFYIQFHKDILINIRHKKDIVVMAFLIGFSNDSVKIPQIRKPNDIFNRNTT